MTVSHGVEGQLISEARICIYSDIKALIITRRAVVSLIRGPQYPRRNSSDILLKKATGGF